MQSFPGLPPQNLLAEPVARNTAPCIGWAASVVARRDPHARLMVVPADHHIADNASFLKTLAKALEATAEGNLVTVGIRPTRPETGYGYIELGEEAPAALGGAHWARRFVEKPSRDRAAQLFASGQYLWNSGMFFFRADAILKAIRTHLPGLARGLEDFDSAAENDEERRAIQEGFADLPSISIDHGVMEKADGVLVVPGDFGWSDLGSWTTAWELSDRDDNGNAAGEDAVLIQATGNLVRAPLGKIVALVGVSDLVVVDTEDALLVVPRERAQEVRRVLQELEARKGR